MYDEDSDLDSSLEHLTAATHFTGLSMSRFDSLDDLLAAMPPAPSREYSEFCYEYTAEVVDEHIEDAAKLKELAEMWGIVTSDSAEMFKFASDTFINNCPEFIPTEYEDGWAIKTIWWATDYNQGRVFRWAQYVTAGVV